MIYHIAQRLTGLLLKNNCISKEEYEQFAYVIQSDIETVITLASIMILSIYLGNVMQTVCFFIYFFALRKRMGGFHLKKYWQCYIGTMGIYFLISQIVKSEANHVNLIIVITIFAALIIIYIGGVYHPNMQLIPEEKNNMIVMSRIICGLELISVLFLDWINMFESVMLYICMAIIVCAVLLIISWSEPKYS